MTARSAADQAPRLTGEDTSAPPGAAATSSLPAIPNKRYFTIGEVGTLCDVKSHVLRYWEQEFSQLKPIKRRGNRRYYQRHDIELIRLIRTLLYEQGFTIAGARQQLSQVPRGAGRDGSEKTEAILDTRKRIEDEQQDRQLMLQREVHSPADAETSVAPKSEKSDTQKATSAASTATLAADANLTDIRLALEALLTDLAPYQND